MCRLQGICTGVHQYTEEVLSNAGRSHKLPPFFILVHYIIQGSQGSEGKNKCVFVKMNYNMPDEHSRLI
jgi:hypothetical protein